MNSSTSGYHFYSDFRKCQKFWFWKYVKRLTPLTSAPALRNGEAFHEAMATFYTTHNLMQAISRLHEFSVSEEDMAKLDDAIRMHTMHYANDGFQVIAVEKELEHVFDIDGKRILLTGRVDLVVKWKDDYFIVDHKTTKWIISKVAESLSVSDQATGYIALWNKLYPEYYATGVIFNIIKLEGRISGGDPIKDLRREIVYRSKDDIKEFLLDIHETSEEIAQKLKHPRWVKDRNACYLYNHRCEYADLCAGANPDNLIGIAFKEEDE